MHPVRLIDLFLVRLSRLLFMVRHAEVVPFQRDHHPARFTIRVHGRGYSALLRETPMPGWTSGRRPMSFPDRTVAENYLRFMGLPQRRNRPG